MKPSLRLSAMAFATVSGLAPLQAQAPMPQPGRPVGQQPRSSTCQEALLALSARMSRDPYWVTGWGASWAEGYGTLEAAPDAPAPGGVAARTFNPWGVAADAGALPSPRRQIRLLYGAAQILAARGDDEACRSVLSELTEVYDAYVRALAEAEVDPDGITGWRKEQIALARPVAALAGSARLSVDDLTGADVRNTEDVQLGSVSDLYFADPGDGVRYVIVARGGMLGFGEDLVPVPWERFLAAPGLNALIVDISAGRFDAAPTLSPDQESTPPAGRAALFNSFWSN